MATLKEPFRWNYQIAFIAKKVNRRIQRRDIERYEKYADMEQKKAYVELLLHMKKSFEKAIKCIELESIIELYDIPKFYDFSKAADEKIETLRYMRTKHVPNKASNYKPGYQSFSDKELMKIKNLLIRGLDHVEWVLADNSIELSQDLLLKGIEDNLENENREEQ